MDKAYTRVNFENLPSHQTPVSATNLNIMDKGIDDIDDRVIALDGSKVDKYKDIPNPIDLNTLTETGFYSIPDLCTNIPSGANGGGQATVQVISTHVSSTNAYIVQIFYNQLQVDNVQQVYFRIGYGTIESPTFLSWQIMAVSSDLRRIAQGIGNMWDLGSYANTSLLYSLGFPTHMYPAAQQGSNAYALDVLSGTVYKNTRMGEYSYTWTPYGTLTIKVDEKVDIATYNVTGAKNLLPMTVDGIKNANTTGGTWSGNACTKAGMTYTILTDPNNNVTGINVDGATTEYPGFNMPSFSLPQGTYILTVGAVRGRLTKNNTQIADVVANSSYTFTVNNSSDIYNFYIFTGRTTIDNSISQPMIRLASDTDSTFRPYAKTNLELTDDVRAIDYRLIDNACVNIAKPTATKWNYANDTGIYTPKSLSDYGDTISEIDCNVGDWLTITFIIKNNLPGLNSTISVLNSNDTVLATFNNYAYGYVVDTIYQKTFKATTNKLKVVSYKASGTSANSFGIQIMISRNPNATYEPYYPNNKELASTQVELSRTRNNITSRLSNLSQAVAEQNLGKYGYKIGDYFVGASGYNYILADYNTFKGTSTPYCLTTNHIGIVVDTKVTSKWHTEDAANVGYNGSTLHTYLKGTVLDNIKTDFIGLFGGSTGLEHLLPHSKLLTTALANWGWQANQYISALSEVQTIGSVVWGANGYQTGEASKKLELFDKYKWTELFESRYPWLRDLYTSSNACYLRYDGYANDRGVTASGHVVGLINFY